MTERQRPPWLPMLAAPLLAVPAVGGEGGQPGPGATEPRPRYVAVLEDDTREAGPEHSDVTGDQVLEIGFELELMADRLNGFALDSEPRDDLRIREAELLAELTYRPRDDVIVFGEVSLIAEREDFRDATPDQSEDALERGETWVRWLQALGPGGSVTAGRQAFEDPRRWWWDDDLDSVRLDYERPRWDAYLGLAEEMARVDTDEDFIDPEIDDVRRLFVHAGWSRADALRLDLFALVQRDHSGTTPDGRAIDPDRVDESDLDAHWLGVRASGALGLAGATGLRYWADFARVSGDESLTEFEDLAGGRSRADQTVEQRLRGWAVDLGAEWIFATGAEPSLSLRYAKGSGDRDPDDRTDRAYRETGLRDPDDEFRLYGELLRPELSNLEVGTIALGFDGVADARVTLGYHRFRQVHAAADLAETRIELDPGGDSRDLGEEISLVVELEAADDLELEFAAASFRAGDAFGAASGERVNSLFAQLTWGF